MVDGLIAKLTAALFLLPDLPGTRLPAAASEDLFGTMSRLVLHKLGEPRVWARIARERLAAPLSLNLICAFVGIFGSYRS